MLTAARGRLMRLSRWERLPLAVVVATFTLGLGLFVTSTVTQDGMVYYSETRSAVYDGNFDLDNEYGQDWSAFSAGRLPLILQSLPRDEAGRFVQVANPGTVVMLAPGVLSAMTGVAALQALGADLDNTGFGTVQFAWAALWAGGLVLASLIVLYRFLAARVGGWPAAGAVLFGLFGSTMALWTLVFPMHAHELALPVTTAIVVLSLARLRHAGPGTYLALGLLLGFVVSVRPLAGLYGVVPAAWLVIRFGGPFVEGLRSRPARLPNARSLAVPIRDGLVLLAGFLAGHLPALLIANDAGLLGSSYYEDTGYLARYLLGRIPRGLFDLVLDRSQGQLWWTPISVVALVGILPALWRDRFVGLSLLGWTIAIYVFVASLGGQSMFGSPNRESRHLADLTPVLIVALGYLLAWTRRRVLRVATAAVIGVLAGYGLLLKLAQIGQSRPPGLTTAVQTLLDPGLLVERAGGLWRTMILGPLVDGVRLLDPGIAVRGLGMAALLVLLVAIITPVAWLAGGGLSGSGQEASSEPAGTSPWPPSGRTPMRRPVRAASAVLVAAALFVGLCGPVGQLLFPPDARLADGSALSLQAVEGGPLTVTGPLDHVAIGSSPSGGSSADRPLPAPLPAPAIVRPQTSEVVRVTPAGVSFTVTAPPTGRLIAMTVPVRARGPSDVTVEARTASGVVLGSTLVPGGAPEVWTGLPLNAGQVPPGDELVIRFVSTGQGPRLAAAEDGGPAASLYFADPATWPGLEADVHGSTATVLEPGTMAPAPAQLVLRPTGDVLRLGPYPADLLLAWSSRHDGWRLTLPRNGAAGGWLAAAQATLDAPMVLQIRAPEPVESIRLSAVATLPGGDNTELPPEDAELRAGTAPPGGEPASFVVDSIDGRAATSAEVALDGGGMRDLDIHVGLRSATGRTAINVLWIDLTLASPDAVAALWAADAGAVTLRPVAADAAPEQRLEVATIADASPLQRLGSAMSSLSAVATGAWPLAIAAAIAAIVAAGRATGGRPWTGAWLAAAGVLLILGILGVPRSNRAPDSPPLAIGGESGDEADVSGRYGP